ncbi:MAG: glutathione peroxidase [Pseudomonadota bacterium]
MNLMKTIAGAALATVLAGAASAGGPKGPQNGSAHAFSFEDIDGAELPLSAYEGKAVLVVNTASRCGFTPQYDGLQSLWESYRDQGLVVLGVPSNDFGAQEPGSNAEIKEFCEVNFDVDFPLAAKADVTGGDAHPFYQWAAAQLGDDARPRWNFHKYLVAPDGTLAAWFGSNVEPTSKPVTRAVETALSSRAGEKG